MKLQTLSPILWTKDLKGTIVFYEAVLGFKSKSSFPNFVSMTRDNVELMFVVPQEEPEDSTDSNDRDDLFPKPALTGSIFILTDEVDDLWKSISGKAIIIKSSIANREYLMRDFSILDNNGYELVFGQDIS